MTKAIAAIWPSTNGLGLPAFFQLDSLEGMASRRRVIVWQYRKRDADHLREIVLDCASTFSLREPRTAELQLVPDRGADRALVAENVPNFFSTFRNGAFEMGSDATFVSSR